MRRNASSRNSPTAGAGDTRRGGKGRGGLMPAILFASARLLREWSSCDPLLQEVTLWMVEHAWDPVQMGPIRITSIYRTKDENQAAGGKTEVHCQRPHRALDVGGAGLTQETIKLTGFAVNSEYQYDSERPSKVVAYSEPHGTGPHLHLQIHPNTKRVHGDDV